MNDIGTQKGTRGTSMSLNNQRGSGAERPSEKSGNHNPGGTKPEQDGQASVPMAIPMPGCKRD